MNVPDNLKYTKDHEWIKEEGNIITIGITDYAQEQLGDIVFVELPNTDEIIKNAETFGAVESVKSVSDCFMPVEGKILEINDILEENPETVNEDCYGDGWMIKVEVKNKDFLDDLMNHEEYEAYVKEETK